MHVAAYTTDRTKAHGIQAVVGGGKGKAKWDDWMRQSRNLKRMLGKGQGGASVALRSGLTSQRRRSGSATSTLARPTSSRR